MGNTFGPGWGILLAFDIKRQKKLGTLRGKLKWDGDLSDMRTER
jgi:hypothetical protein